MRLGRHRLARWALPAGLSLVLGLVTTVAVALALAMWLPHRDLSRAVAHGKDPSGQRLSTAEFGRAGMLRRYWRLERPIRANVAGDLRFAGFGSGRGPFRDRPPAAYQPTTGPRWGPSLDDSPRAYGWEDARGWPALALWCEFITSHGAGLPAEAQGGAILVPSESGLELRAMPLRPLWPGLVANTGVYAAVWGGLLAVPGWARRRRRRRRGRCEGCGYDLAGLTGGAACPECGNELDPELRSREMA